MHIPKKNTALEHTPGPSITLAGANFSNGLGEYCAHNRAKASRRERREQMFVHTPLMERF